MQLSHLFSIDATIVDEGTTFDKDPSEGKIVMEIFDSLK